jgi:hypothetical protein
VYENADIQPTWPLLLKREKVDAILIVFLLNYWANHGFKLCQNNPLVIPFQNLSGSPVLVPRSVDAVTSY